jgi:hypothetical protein
MVFVDGVQCRIWEGTSEAGTPCMAFIPRVAVSGDHPPEKHAEFKRELLEQRPPSDEAAAIPLRMIL